jgi:hypothetical protein
MNAKLPLIIVALAVSFLASPPVRSQDNPLDDPDIQAALKQAQELQKDSKPVKISDLKKQADEIQAEQKKEEQKEKAALKKQLETPGPIALPGWTPTTPKFTATGPLTKKLNDDEVRITQTGTSPLSPAELGDAWLASVADKEINHTRNNISTNGAPVVILYLSTRTDPREEVRMEARRTATGKITQINISSALPKPEEDSDDD